MRKTAVMQVMQDNQKLTRNEEIVSGRGNRTSVDART